MSSQLPPAVFQLCRKVSEEQHVELYHVELAGRVLKVEIDAPGGTTLVTCARFSQALSAELDLIDALPGRYLLEVSSPGVERRLYRPADFSRAVGARVRIATPQRTWEGRLLAADDSTVKLTCNGRDEAAVVSLAYDDIAEARLVVSNDELLRVRPRPKEHGSMTAPESAGRQKGKQ